MPTVLIVGPYRFFFYSSDWQEPPHIHVERDHLKAKFWLNPVRLERSSGFASAELNKVQRLVSQKAIPLRRSWHEYFGD
jgi:hypothetical protein